jgi:hypothetical protein
MKFLVIKHRTSGVNETTLVDNYQTAAVLASEINKYEGCPVTVDAVSMSWRSAGWNGLY